MSTRKPALGAGPLSRIAAAVAPSPSGEADLQVAEMVKLSAYVQPHVGDQARALARHDRVRLGDVLAAALALYVASRLADGLDPAALEDTATLRPGPRVSA